MKAGIVTARSPKAFRLTSRNSAPALKIAVTPSLSMRKTESPANMGEE